MTDFHSRFHSRVAARPQWLAKGFHKECHASNTSASGRAGGEKEGRRNLADYREYGKMETQKASERVSVQGRHPLASPPHGCYRAPRYRDNFRVSWEGFQSERAELLRLMLLTLSPENSLIDTLTITGLCVEAVHVPIPATDSHFPDTFLLNHYK